MGGPLICHYLMPDGCFVPGGNPSALFSSDGRHFVSPMPAGSGRWLPAEELSRRRYWERLVFPLRP
ncbi:hypothetical protein D3C76_715420 [compost metagenome]